MTLRLPDPLALEDDTSSSGGIGGLLSLLPIAQSILRRLGSLSEWILPSNHVFAGPVLESICLRHYLVHRALALQDWVIDVRLGRAGHP